MSAVNGREISHIRDEDLLKKMWQDTEDFGRKKEIRAHMYKLREERLKDLYCNTDIKDVHLITNKKTSFNQSMHADALADHSFASLKKKEIRDSESPTKEVSYRTKGPSSNEGWNISKIEEHSQDGKKHKYAQSAHTSGTEIIPQGKLDFEAKNSQEVVTFHDGDEKNFVKSQGTSSNSFIRQDAVGGDANSNFRTSSTKSSTSSRTVTESKSGFGDATDYPQQLVIEGVNNNKNNFGSSRTVTENKSSFGDGTDRARKQIIIESVGRDDYNDSIRSSNQATSSSRVVTEHKSYDDNSRKALQISDDVVVGKTTKIYTTDAPKELKSHPGYVEGRTKITRETKTLADGTVVTTTKYETKGSNEATSSSSNQYTSSSSFHDNKSNVVTSKSHDEKFSSHKVTQDSLPSTKNQPKSRYYVEKTHTIPSTTDTINVHARRESNVSEKKIDTTKNYQSHVDQKFEVRTTDNVTQNRSDTTNTENVRKQTIQHVDLDVQNKENIRREVVDKNRVQQKTVATHDVNSVPLGTPIEIEINLTRMNDNQEKTFKTQKTPGSYEPQVGKQQVPKTETPNVYDTPQRREPMRHESEMSTKTKVTDGQYDTTYRTDYTNKKISVEVSPTHDAFARSLRAVSPDRLTSRTSSRNLKNSNSSLRSSSSPEKTYSDRRHPQRMSPDRQTNGRCYSPTKKTPEKFSSTETITYRRPSAQRISPDKNQRTKHSNEIKITTTTTKKTDDETIYRTPQSTLKNKPRSSIPNGSEHYSKTFEITTDLDDNLSTYSQSTVTRNKTDKVTSDVDSKTVKEFYIHEQNKPRDHPTNSTLKKDKPLDRPLKRTDTYEERCRQILGITGDSNERRRSSLEKLRKRGSITSSQTEPLPKTSPEKPESPRQKSPTKQVITLQEFPAQIRRSPEKSSPERRMPKEPSPTKTRKPSVEGRPIQEYPSQHPNHPGNNDKQDSPTRSSPRRTVDNRQERKPSTERNQPSIERRPIQEYPSQHPNHPGKNDKQDSPTRSSPRRTVDSRQERKPSTELNQPSVERRPIQEYPSQHPNHPGKNDKQDSPTRSSPRRTVDSRQERKPSTERNQIQEFPSQTRKTPEKDLPEEREFTTRSKPKNKEDGPERKLSTQHKPLGEYPSQKRPSPDKKEQEYPTRTSPGKTVDWIENTNEGTKDKRTDIRTTVITTHLESGRMNPHKPRECSPSAGQVHSEDYEVRDNIHITVENRNTPKSNERPTKQHPTQENSPDNKVFNNQKTVTTFDKHKKISEVDVTTTRNDKTSSTNITRKDSITNTRKDSPVKPTHIKPGKKETNEDSSSEEEDLKITETKITGEVIYDIPRSAMKKKPNDKTKTTEETTSSISAIDKDIKKDEVNVKRIISDYVSEDEQVTNHYHVETLIDNEDQVTEIHKGGPSYKTTEITIQEKTEERKSPKKSTPNEREDVSTIKKSQQKLKPQDSYDVKTVEEIDIIEDLLTTDEKTTKDEKVTKSKTVGELVKNFTLKETNLVEDTVKPSGKPSNGRPSSSPSRNSINPKNPTKNHQNPSYSVDIQVEETATTTTRRTSTDLSKKSPQKTPVSQDTKNNVSTFEDDVQAEFTSVTITEVSTDERQPSSQPKQKGPKMSPSKRPSVEEKPFSTVRTTSEQRNTKYSTTNTTDENIYKQPQKPKDSTSKKLKHFDQIDIEVEEIITIESDEEINEGQTIRKEYPSQTTTKIVNLEDENEVYEHELKEVELITSSNIPQDLREPKYPTKYHQQKTRVPEKPDSTPKDQNDYVKKSTEHKRIHTDVKTENIKDRIIKKPTTRTPSSSSLTKKPVTPQKINRYEESDVEIKNKTSTIRKTYEQTKSDSLRRNVHSPKPTNDVSKKTPTQRPYSKKPVETVDRSKKTIKKIPCEEDSDSDEDVEEIHTKKHVMETYEGRTPVEEPLVMKKSISLLYSDDEDDKKTTQMLIESEITEKQPITNQKKEKPVKSPKTTTTNLINNEKTQVSSPKSRTPLKASPLINKTSKKPEITRKPELPKQTQPNGYKSYTKDHKQNTLKDIETFNNVTENEIIHVRTNRVDETVNKKKTTALIDGNKPNRSPKPTNLPKTSNGFVPKRSSSKTTVEQVTTKTTTKVKEPMKPTPKSSKPSEPKTITSTVSSKTKTETKTKTNVKGKSETLEKKSKPIPRKLEEPEDSDEESIPDSLNESVYSSVNEFTSNVKRTDTNIENITTRTQTEKHQVFKPEKKGISTNRVIIKSNDRGTVDLQRSISSREPTPDRMCPLPVTSDDEGFAPRYPDKVVEPDEVSTKKRFDRLFETTIHENGDSIQSKKIVEIREDTNQRVSQIDRVDNDDESLMTVNRKINKFLTTAEKLTEKPIVDISQPAPKVARPKFEVNDDLKEDDCLLSVSDKVQKFITEAEHLTTHKDTQHRKSVNIETKSDISNKINQFTLPHQNETNSPRKSSVPKNVLPSSTGKEPRQPERTTASGKITLDQDVFITTECAEIEKESDLFRTSKKPTNISKRPNEPEYDSPRSNKEIKSTKTTSEITSSIRKTSLKNVEISDEEADEATSKPRKNSLKEFTPKNRRPSQEDKVILSSVGRLRSNESIKKAKSIFDNTESTNRDEKRQEDILNRPSIFEGRNKTIKDTTTRKSIDRKNVTPKRLIFSYEKETEDIQQEETRSISRHHVDSQKRTISKELHSSERNIPGYMKPLDRQSKPRDESPEELEPLEQDRHQPRRKYSDKPENGHGDVEPHIPGYMKPLERTNHHHPQEPNSQIHRSRHSDFENTTHSHHRSTEWSNKEGDTPGYMKPLDRSEHHHPKSEGHRSTTTDETHKHYTSTDWTYKPSGTNEDDIPGYMQPLDRSIHHHPNEPEAREHKHTPRHSVPHGSTTDWSYKPLDTNEGDTPGYMKPLDRSSRPEFDSRERSTSPEIHIGAGRHHDLPKGEIEGYRKPLDRSSRPEFDSIESPEIHIGSGRHHELPKGEIEGYRMPLDRSSRPEFDSRERSTSPEIHIGAGRHHELPKGEIEGYRKPLDRSSRPEFDSRERSTSPEIHIGAGRHHELPKGEIEGYRKPLDRSSRPEFDSIESPEIHIGSGRHHELPKGEIEGYRKPLDRSSRPEFDSIESPEIHIGSGRHHELPKGEIDGYRKPLDRSSRPEFDSIESPEIHIGSGRHHDLPKGEIEGYRKPLDRSSRPEFDSRERSQSPEIHIGSGRHHELPDGQIPGYMKPLDRTDTHRSHSPKKEAPIDNRPRETQGTPTKFGVTLKRTDSTKAVTTSLTTTATKKHPLLLKKLITEEEIEEVYELEVLEELLLKFTIYELRRKIRNQIRIVKKLISEGKLEITIKNLKNTMKNTDHSVQTKETRKETQDNRTTKRTSPSRTSPMRTSPTRKTQETHSINRNDVVERRTHGGSQYTVESSRKSSVTTTTSSERVESRTVSTKSPDKRYPERNPSNRSTPERSSPERKYKPNSERNNLRDKTTPQQTPSRPKGKEEPEISTKTSSTNIFKSSLKKTEPKGKTPTSAPQPEWVTQRNLKKTGTNEIVKKSTVTSNSSTVKKQNTKTSSSRQSESTDLIASSYGIGPTDENGAPLFGLRALRAQNTNGTSKVQGTVISSQYYSETGKEPVGQISVTKYSSDPRDLGSDENLTKNGDVLSVTTTQKYGYDDTPSLKQLTRTDKEICDSQTNRRRSSSKTSTITRKNSVKALTQKFVENAVEVSKNERQPSYPKAGLILRSSSFKNDSAVDDGYSEVSVSADERIQESVSVKSSNSKTVSGGTFLRNKSKVTGVQDAITRMKAEDINYGDAKEDIEAKDLLNKYLGTQVILSGIEGQISRKGSSSTKASSFSTSAKSTSRITTVTMENGKEVTKTRTFEHPLSDDVLETIWDEQTLRYLLDQSTDYEERKNIRARLRLIMAEQEACTELVKQASQDQSSQSIDETVETSKEVISEGPVTTTKVTRVSTQQQISKKPMSPFAKFRQLDKQNSLNTPPSTPRTPGGSPLFKFTDAALSQSASTIKDRLLYWCRMKTKEYENIQLDNFSSSWADGLAFCALVHHFLPEAFDYHALTPKERRHNFTLAFKVADEKADIAPLLDVDDMVATMRPDWKCVFTYVQSIYRRFKDED